MKSIHIKIVFILTMAFFLGTISSHAKPVIDKSQHAIPLSYPLENLLTITPHEYTELTGKKLKFDEVVKLKLAQAIYKKASLKMGVSDEEPKSQVIAMLLVLIVGVFGIHRFYLGYTAIGILQFLTFGGCLVWWIVDIVLIMSGNLGPKDGSEYFPEFKDV